MTNKDHNNKNRNHKVVILNECIVRKRYVYTTKNMNNTKLIKNNDCLGSIK